MEDAMTSTALLLNDDIEGAESRLRARKDSSTFHLMGLGVSTFMRSVLGFEKEFMNEANTRLLECETRAWNEMKKAQVAATGGHSGGGLFGRPSTSPAAATPPAGVVAGSIYPPGSEYALVHAESQIMLAIVAELNESLTEAIRGFYKLRKAFVSLNGIIESEDAFLRGETSHHGHSHSLPRLSMSSGRRMSYTDDPMPGAFDDKEFADLEAEMAAEEAAAAARGAVLESKANGTGSPKAANGTTAAAAAAATAAAAAPGGIENKAPSPTLPQTAHSLSEKTAALSLNGNGNGNGTISPSRASGQISRSQTPTSVSAAAPASSSTFRARKRHLDTLTNPIDIFVHSGANLCFGVLLVLISMVPPAFSKLLSIVGFKGDRERGVRMLWQSTKFPNVYGGLAGLMLLVYYNSLIANADILPSDADIAELTNNVGTDSSEMEVVGYPKDRCHALLAHMRTLYPDSLLWVLEEARLLTAERRIKEAMAVLQTGGSDGKPRVAKMRQITALTKFELAINAMCTMNWTLMRDSFLACVELNTWSHAMYYYNVGCAELELYRDAFHNARALAGAGAGNTEAANAAKATAAKHKKSAEMYLRKAPTMAGRKKFMARQMPFDMFVNRRLARWEERAKKHGIDLADAVGMCPAMEMAYLWGSAKKMSDDLLELALNKYLVWERCTADSSVVAAFQAAPDESGIGNLCRAALLRALGRLEDAQAVLDKELLVHDRALFKGPTKDDYVLPAGYYEAAVILWLQASDPKYFPAGADAAAVDAYRHKKTNESLALLDKVAKWETYVLDTRIGMKLQTGLDAVKWLKAKKNWQ